MCRKFFIACGDTAVLFEQIEAAFDQIAGLVTMTIIVAGIFAVRAGRNDRLGFLRLDPFDQGVGVVAFVSDHRPRPRRVVKQGRGLADVGVLTDPVRVKPMGLPSASTMPWILVPKPPRERPRACGPCFF